MDPQIIDNIVECCLVVKYYLIILISKRAVMRSNMMLTQTVGRNILLPPMSKTKKTCNLDLHQQQGRRANLTTSIKHLLKYNNDIKQTQELFI